MMLPELLCRLDLHVAAEAIPLLERLVDELLRWNPRRNLTAIIDRDEVLEKHLVDSLTLLPFARHATHLLDIGSGAGFPALPLKIACPDLKVVSVDAVGKKVDFQRHVARTLGLKGFTAVHARVEALTDCRAAFDLVTARALCSLTDLVGLAGPFLASGGRLVAMKGPEGRHELYESRDRLELQGWSAVLHNLELPVSGAERCLIELSC
jgi:16S rRNA (guanine527-N7)-methyltransferase